MKKQLLFIYLPALLLLACEKVIEIDLNSADPQLVVEGFVENGGQPYVNLSYTANYFDSNNFTKATGAIVNISDGTGLTVQLDEVTDGDYRSKSILGITGRTYTLNILSNGQEYSASSVMPELVDIDSLTYVYKPTTTFTVAGFYVTLHFKEPAGKGHKYLFKIYKNGVVPFSLSRGGDGPFLISEDEFFDGMDFDFEFYPYPFKPFDEVVVELVSLNDEGFEFYKTLNATLNSNSGGAFSELPQNPTTNMSEGAIGYFGAVAISRAMIITK